MPDVVVCYKWVVDERDVRVEKGELVFDRVGYKISDYDRNAIEEAVRIKEALGGTVTAVTVGPSSAQASVKDALQRGPDSLYFVAYEGELDSEATSLILSRVVNKLNFDLIVLGEGSADVYAQQVGPRLAQKLGLPCLTYVNKVTVAGDKVIGERKLEGGIEAKEAPLPAVVTVTPDINVPRIPGLKAVLEAKKKPVQQLDLAALGLTEEDVAPRCETLSLKGTSTDRKQIVWDRKELSKLVDILIKEKVIA